MKQEQTKYMNDIRKISVKIKENQDKIKLNIQLPWLVSNIQEILDIDPEEEQEQE